MNTKGVEDGISDDRAEGVAVRFTGKNCISLLRWMGNPHWSNEMLHSTDAPFVETIQGPIAATVDDWVVKTDGGELILCRPVVEPAAVPEAPTFSYQLAMYLTRNGADAPHMQAEINRFLYDGKWKTTQSRNQKEK